MSDDATTPSHDELLAKAGVLTDALPYMRAFNDKTVVVKYGGHAMGNSELSLAFARDIVLLKQVGINPVVVHGGGPQIGAMLERLKIKSQFVDGLRVTDEATVEIVEMVLSGSINKSIVSSINAVGGLAVGLSGKDGNLIKARKLRRTKADPDSNIEKILDLGFVGEPYQVEPTLLHALAASDIIPVVAPIGLGDNGETFNINADTVAGAVASALKAARLLMLTDVAGVLNGDKRLIADMSVDQARNLIADGTVSGGMIPKVETCIDAVANDVEAAVIMDGRTTHAILLELFTEHGVGTAIWNM
jgi:acetylglutamate kinase